MIPITFILRIIQVSFYLAILIAALVGLYYITTWAIRLAWDIIEANNKDLAKWLKAKLPQKKSSFFKNDR